MIKKSVFAIIIFIILLEVFSRCFFSVFFSLQYQINKVLCVNHNFFWVQKKNIKTFFQNVIVDLDERGLRNEQKFKNDKDNNVFRVVCLGASPTFGWGVLSEETYPYLLKKELQKKYCGEKDIEVINAGVIGYSSYQGKNYFKQNVLSWSPDVVAVSYLVNDVDEYRFFMNNGLSDRSIGDSFLYRKVVFLLEQSYLYKFINNLFMVNKLIPWKGKGHVVRVSQGDYYENICEIIGLAEANNINLIFVGMPILKDLPQDYKYDITLKAKEYLDRAKQEVFNKNYKKALELTYIARRFAPYSKEVYYYMYFLEKKCKIDAYSNNFKKAQEMSLYECVYRRNEYVKILKRVSLSNDINFIDFNEYICKNYKRDKSMFLVNPQHDFVHFSKTGNMFLAELVSDIILKIMETQRR